MRNCGRTQRISSEPSEFWNASAAISIRCNPSPFQKPRLATLPLRRYIYLGENDLTAANNEYFFDYPLITAYARSENGLIHKSGLGAYLDTNAPPDDAEDIRVLPQQLCLVCNFRGSYDAVYTRIAELYRKHANLPLSRTAYAVNVVDHLVENNQNNYIVNIQIPVLDTQQCSTKAAQ